MNEIASEQFDELWREYYRTHPEEWAKVKENARKAEEFTEKLRQSLRGEDDMCDKCTKRVLGRLIYDAEAKLNKVWAEVEKNPKDFSNDGELLSLMNSMSKMLEKYEKIK